MSPLSASTILAAADEAMRLIPPAWPLAATVAVNPFLGHTGDSLAEAQNRLARAAGLRLTMPRDWYAKKIADGAITDDDLAAALADVPGGSLSTDALKQAALAPTPAPRALPTVASLAAATTGLDLEGIVTDRISAWAAGYFDEGQAHWAAARGGEAEEAGKAWMSWQSFATHDLTPEILGVAGFAAHAARAPQRADEAIILAAAGLRLEAEALPGYFHALLLTLGAGRMWRAGGSGRPSSPVARTRRFGICWRSG